MTYGIGIKENRKCYDGKVHECTVTDCAVMLTGRTYKNKETIKADRFTWWPHEITGSGHWVKLVDNEAEIAALVNKYEALGVKCQVKANYRITDTDVNPIEA